MSETMDIPVPDTIQNLLSVSPVWIQVGTLFTGESERALKDAHVVFDHRSIRYVGSSDALPSPDFLRNGQCEPDLTLPDYTLIPGLIEAHAHFFLEGGELDFSRRKEYLEQTSEALLSDARKRLGSLALFGVMGVRDAGDKDRVGLTLAAERRAGIAEGLPYVDSPGAGFHHLKRYGKFMGEAVENYSTPAEAVAARENEGAERIKLIPTGIINFEKGIVSAKPQMEADEVRAFCVAARSFGLQTFAHASGTEGIQHAIDGGVDSIEHGFFLIEDQLKQMRDRDIAWVPTFAPVQIQVDHAALFGWSDQIRQNLEGILAGHAASLRRAHDLGVRVIAGSDAGSCGVAHGLGFILELELMERAGLAPAAVLRSATGSGAERLAFREPVGRIAKGFRSRMILCRHSPLEAVSNLRRERMMIIDGKVYQADETTQAPLM